MIQRSFSTDAGQFSRLFQGSFAEIASRLGPALEQSLINRLNQWHTSVALSLWWFPGWHKHRLNLISLCVSLRKGAGSQVDPILNIHLDVQDLYLMFRVRETLLLNGLLYKCVDGSGWSHISASGKATWAWNMNIENGSTRGSKIVKAHS